ncbi:unnamed protein product [Oikopleura dioica]|uniref:40S ribosomal protein S15 n=1 Tax=Oikopleura dioica TaxID=34765 RepID=E4X1C4_OIKDI|nr:unnamed protein product [Oikopleura dioica]CBY35371.1 unnamed protein product [Oikopleura dioica]
MAEVQIKKKRTFKKYTFRGVDLDQLLNLKTENLVELLGCRQRRHYARGIKRREENLLKRLRASKRAVDPNEPGAKPACVKTHLRSVIIIPEMVGAVVGIYNGKVFNQVEIKPEMIGYYLAEFSMSYKPVRHGRPGIGATHSSRFVPLK